MDQEHPDDSSHNELRALYPDLTIEQLDEVEDTLDQYVGLVLRIYDRIAADPEAYRAFKALTGSDERSTINTIKR